MIAAEILASPILRRPMTQLAIIAHIEEMEDRAERVHYVSAKTTAHQGCGVFLLWAVCGRVIDRKRRLVVLPLPAAPSARSEREREQAGEHICLWNDGLLGVLLYVEGPLR